MASRLPIYRLETCSAEDYPRINWSKHQNQGQAWMEIDEHYRAGESIEGMSAAIAYTGRLGRRWKRIDAIDLRPGTGISVRAREVLEGLGLSGLRFLPFQFNEEPFYLTYTERCLDCLDREHSELVFSPSSPERVLHIRSYRFHEEPIRELDLFTIPEKSSGMFFWAQETFLTEPVKRLMEAAGLAGFQFRELHNL